MRTHRLSTGLPQHTALNGASASNPRYALGHAPVHGERDSRLPDGGSLRGSPSARHGRTHRGDRPAGSASCLQGMGVVSHKNRGSPGMPGVYFSAQMQTTDIENHRCVYIGGSVAGMTGFEPAVSTLTGSHVRPLHHIPMWSLV